MFLAFTLQFAEILDEIADPKSDDNGTNTFVALHESNEELFQHHFGAMMYAKREKIINTRTRSRATFGGFLDARSECG